LLFANYAFYVTTSGVDNGSLPVGDLLNTLSDATVTLVVVVAAQIFLVSFDNTGKHDLISCQQANGSSSAAASCCLQLVVGL